MLAANVDVFGDDTLSFSNQVALLASAGVAAMVGKIRLVDFEQMIATAAHHVQQAIPAIILLLLIGSLAASWLISGIIPAMIYYGLKLLHPDYFLLSACVICAMVSLATGSSWGTIATVGIALIGIGSAMGYHEGLCAGAIISGAYFGDKMSPLSDTTNLAPAVAGAELFSHIRYMTITTFPTFAITLAVFTIWGLSAEVNVEAHSLQSVPQALVNIFHVSPWLFIVPVAVAGMIVLKIPALVVMGVGVVAGIATAYFVEPDLVNSIQQGQMHVNDYGFIMTVLGTGVSIPVDDPILSELLSSGGMKSMLDTVWLILCAMIFGGMMDKSGCLDSITRQLLKLAKTRTSLFGTTALSAIFMNLTASDQYLAIVVPGRMYQKAFKENNLAPENLSRTLEDAGTVTSVLIPWNTCGATQSTVLGVATAVYWPYCIFCLLSPLSTMVVALLGIKIKTRTNNTQ
ncbi:MAG: Na+/H+ antiporter NhaC family protein [Salibacteraceae bacterium]